MAGRSTDEKGQEKSLDKLTAEELKELAGEEIAKHRKKIVNSTQKVISKKPVGMLERMVEKTESIVGDKIGPGGYIAGCAGAGALAGTFVVPLLGTIPGAIVGGVLGGVSYLRGKKQYDRRKQYDIQKEENTV